MNYVRNIVCLSMYCVAFKYNPRIVTNDSAYPWKVPENKYALDRKILKEEGYATVDRKRMSQWLLMDPKTHMRIDSKKTENLSVSNRCNSIITLPSMVLYP